MEIDWMAVAARWVHVGTAVVLVGGLVFMRFVLAPAAAQLADDAHTKLRELVIARWKRFIHGGIALFLISGFYNYLVVQAPMHKGDKLYHALMGTKILLALVVFFLSSALIGRSKAFAGMRANPKLWQGVIVSLAALIIAISGFAKVALKERPATPAVAVDTSQG
ncbi:MAG: hypothetical protein JSS49_02660 [Planctomycetes bacterium]|nr:hypothetical protein [Planctomycetota bacterium]